MDIEKYTRADYYSKAVSKDMEVEKKKKKCENKENE